MISGNKTKKDYKINLGFKLKNKDWFVLTISEDDKNSMSGTITQVIVTQIIQRFATKSEAPF
jgi:hypothetical protein